MASGDSQSWRWVRWGGAVAVVGAVLIGGVSMAFRGGEAGLGGGPLEVGAVAQMSFPIVLQSSGELIAQQQVELRNELGASVKILELIAEGTRVEAGMVVARLSTEELEKQIKEEALALSQARAELASAEIAMAIGKSENESAVRKATVALELARLEMRKWTEGEVASRRQRLAIELDDAKTKVSRTTEKLTQAKSLALKGFISQDELVTSELEARSADGSLRTAVMAGDIFERFEYPKELRTRETTVADTEGELERATKKAEGDLADKSSQFNNRKRSLDLRQAQETKLKETLDKAALTAPVAGMVVYSSTINRWITEDNLPWRVGKTIHPGQPLVVLPESSSMAAKLKIAESLSGRVKPGVGVTMKIDARTGQSLSGVVESIGALAEQDWGDAIKMFSVIVTLGPAAQSMDLKPSMRVEAELLVDRVENALAVPVTSVFADGALRYVYVLADGADLGKGASGKLKRAAVRLGRKSDRFAEVLAGVNAGQRVLLRDARPGEASVVPWSDEMLAAAGCTRSSEGAIVLIAAPPAATVAAALPSVSAGKPGSEASANGSPVSVGETVTGADEKN